MSRLGIICFAASLVSACDGEILGTVDGGVGVVDGGDSDGGTDDAGALDAGDDDAGSPDGGVLDCRGDYAVQSPPCENDSDFCDSAGDSDVVPARDFTELWTRVEGGVTVFHIRFAAPPFTGGSQQIELALREDGEVHDWEDEVYCGAKPADPLAFSASLNVVSSGQRYVPDVAFYACSPGDDDCFVEFDVCETIFVSENQRTLEIRVPLPLAIDSTWLVASSLNGACDTPDGFDRSAFVPVRSGQQDGIEARSICDVTCPPE